MNVWEGKEFEESIVTLLKKRNLIPIFGSGISCGCRALKGKVPSGVEYKEQMIKVLSMNDDIPKNDINMMEKETFSKVCTYYEDDDNVPESVRIEYLKNNFSNVKYSNKDVRRQLFSIEWPYIYSLNIDDAIERNSNYNTVILPNREYRENIFDNNNCVVKLHGDIDEIIKYKDGSKIFTTKEYVVGFESNAFLLNKLRDDYANQNILILGCSLEDEMDLLSMENGLQVKYAKENELSKTVFLLRGKPSRMQLSNFKSYGITDIVWFKEFSDIYNFLLTAWEKASTVQNDGLDFYEHINVQFLSAPDVRNQDFFFNGHTLLDVKTSTVSYPYYFVGRNLTRKILNSIHKNKVHLIYGRKVSGKSYLLADIYRSVKDRKVYFFDGTTKVSDSALEKLLRMENIISLFDIGAIDRDQFEHILTCAKQINEQRSNFVINVNNNDSDTFGIVKMKLKEGFIEDADILRYEIKNRWNGNDSFNELNAVNKLLPFVGLPICKRKMNFLDHILLADRELGINGKYGQIEIDIRTVKDLALLIMLAVKEKVFSIEIISHALHKEMLYALEKYDPFIEVLEAKEFERSKSYFSSIKYVLNSKLWLRKELGDYAKDKSNYKNIADAIHYIVSNIMLQNKNTHVQQKKCRSFILFDVLNDVFLNEKGGQISLLVHIYSRLHSILANDYNFLHQYAKCYINYSKVLSEKDKKIECLEKAAKQASVSKSIIEGRLQDSTSIYLNIAFAHVQHTKANALCRLCYLEDYKVNAHVINAIEAVYLAFSNQYNYIEKEKGFDDFYYAKDFLNNFKLKSIVDVKGEHVNMVRYLLDIVK